jgi:glutamyl-tRNA reductase
VVGTNHKRAPIEARERLWCRPESLPSRLRTVVREGKSIKEAVILSTCNRTEIYTASSQDPTVSEYLTKLLSQWSGLKPADLKQELYSLSGEQAVRHLMDVASGLDSLVVGEEQIQGQVKDAIRVAAQTGTIGRLLSELFHYAHQAATRIREQSGLGVEGASVSSAAISLLQEVARDRPIKSILLIGAGKMISLAAEDLSTFPGVEILVANRTIQRAKELAARFGGKPIGFDEIPAAIQIADAVLTCTSAADRIIRAEDIEAAMTKREGRRLVIVDTAVPRNVDPASSRIPNIRLYNIDDLSPLMKDAQSYRPKILRAEELARREAENFCARLRAYEAVDTLKDLRKVAESIREKELTRALRRLGSVSEREKEIVDLLTRRIVNKLLYEPTARLKEHASNGDGETYETVLRELFAIGKDSEQ